MRRIREEAQREIRVAWRTANYSRADKLPSLQKELARLNAPTQPKKAPSMKQQRANLQMLSEFLGRPLGKTRLKRKPSA